MQPSCEKWFSSSQRTIITLGREQMMKLLIWMGVEKGVLSDNDNNHLLRLIYVYTGKKPDTRLCDFLCNTKGQFREQMQIIHKMRAGRDPNLAITAFDPSDENKVQTLAKDNQFNDSWLEPGQTDDGKEWWCRTHNPQVP